MIHVATFLMAIALVESGNVDSKIGKHQERSRYQITRTVWEQYCKRWDFDTKAKSPFYSTQIAASHLRWLIKNGVPEEPFCMALAWNSGVKGFYRACKLGPSKPAKDYAIQVEATYNDLLKKEKR